jgi:hypothetical protein
MPRMNTAAGTSRGRITRRSGAAAWNRTQLYAVFRKRTNLWNVSVPIPSSWATSGIASPVVPAQPVMRARVIKCTAARWRDVATVRIVLVAGVRRHKLQRAARNAFLIGSGLVFRGETCWRSGGAGSKRERFAVGGDSVLAASALGEWGSPREVQLRPAGEVGAAVRASRIARPAAGPSLGDGNGSVAS